MKKSLIVPIIISIVLFFLPFFWFKPGEMDLGGDNTRLYFYDPLNYMLNQTLYNVVSSGIGGVALSYYAFPFMFLLKILKSFVDSPTILISIVNGLNLSVAFISIYFIVKDLDNTQENSHESSTVEYSAILAGFFYIFSPYLIAGWDRNILTHSQFFLNPLMFLLLLRYFITKNIKYLLVALLITFIFSPNFASVAAPPVFSFYPLSLLFIFLYAKYIKNLPIPLKGLFFGFLVFIMLQLFHIVPQVLTIFTPGSQIGKDIFSESSKFSQGQDYFNAVASSIKVSISWMNLSQNAKLSLLSYAFIIFPLIAIIGLIRSKRKLLPFIGVFFLITLFFATANITDIGFNFYKSLFYIPGFRMFRNFYGQWGFVFVFFYTLLIGLSLQSILDKVNKKLKYIIITSVFGLLFINAWPFINGSLVHIDLFQTDHIKPVIQMDPNYKNVLSHVRKLPVDGKMLSFPFTDPGYQIIAGRKGGAYIGPSTFSYLTGKSDFNGYAGISPYGDIFLKSIRDKEFDSLQRLFSKLNIKYVFYNSDPNIYEKGFLEYPYSYVRGFLPKDQSSYKNLLKELPIDLNNGIDFGDKYHIYPVIDSVYLPHIYTSTDIIYTTDPLKFISEMDFIKSNRSSIFFMNDSKKSNDDLTLEAKPFSPFELLLNNFHLHRHAPFISLNLNDPRYPFALILEKFKLFRLRYNHDSYIDYSLFFLSKRVYELDKLGDKMQSANTNSWREPKIWEYYNWNTYNSWEASLYRYRDGMKDLILWVNKSNVSGDIKDADKIKINEQLNQHKLNLINIIRGSNKTVKEEKYLSDLADNIFAEIYAVFNYSLADKNILNYKFKIPGKRSGAYEIYVKNSQDLFSELANGWVEINGKKFFLEENNNVSLLKAGTVTLSNQGEVDFSLHLKPKNLVGTAQWENSGDINRGQDQVELTPKNSSGNNTGGLTQELTGWQPNKQYLISFNYQTFGDNFLLKIFDRQLNDDKFTQNTYLDTNLNSISWKTYQEIITSNSNSRKAFVQIEANTDREKSKIIIKNFSTTEVDYPTVILKKKNNNPSFTATRPKITFTKINPTKYIIKVSNVQNPYTLIFLEAFNHNWNLVNKDRNSSSFKSKITRLFALIDEKITSIFIKNKPRDNKVTASYFNGEVKEGENANIFLEPNTFETWGKDSIASRNHFPVYGYANAWIINPKDMSGKTDYTLILEMGTQKHFYFLLCVSIFTFLSLVIYLLIKIFRKNEKNN